MWHIQLNRRRLGIRIALLAGTCLLTASAGAAPASSLSKWLSREAVPELREQLRNHPRYQNQRVAVISNEDDALSEALATLLSMNLRDREGIRLWEASGANSPAAEVTGSIDDIRYAKC